MLRAVSRLRRRENRGSALVMVSIAAAVTFTLGAALLALAVSSSQQTLNSARQSQAAELGRGAVEDAATRLAQYNDTAEVFFTVAPAYDAPQVAVLGRGCYSYWWSAWNPATGEARVDARAIVPGELNAAGTACQPPARGGKYQVTQTQARMAITSGPPNRASIISMAYTTSDTALGLVAPAAADELVPNQSIPDPESADGCKAPTIAGGSTEWYSQASRTVAASAICGFVYSKTGSTVTGWGAPSKTNAVTITAEGQAVVAFKACDIDDLTSTNCSTWQPYFGSFYQPTVVDPPVIGEGDTAGIIRIDRTAPTVPTLTGTASPSLTGLSIPWSGTQAVVGAGNSVDTPGGGANGSAGIESYQLQTSLDGTTWATQVTDTGSTASYTVTAAGKTWVRARACDAATPANCSAWSAAGAVWVDLTAPSSCTITNPSASWQNVASIALTCNASTDAESGVAVYQAQTSNDGGGTWGASVNGTAVSVVTTITQQGETWLRARACNNATPALCSAWVSPANQPRIDRTAPTVPTLAASPCSSNVWSNAASCVVTFTSTDTPATGAVGSTNKSAGLHETTAFYYSTSTDNGVTWSATTAVGPTANSLTVTLEGATLVRAYACDASVTTANCSANSASTFKVMLDRTAPSAPAAYDSATWFNAATKTVTVSGSTDTAGASGVNRYESQKSLDGGTTWQTLQAGANGTTSLGITATGDGASYFRVRSVDVAGNLSAWTMGYIRLDTYAPTACTVTNANGGSWSNAASVTVSCNGSSDPLNPARVAGLNAGLPASNAYSYTTQLNGGAVSAPTYGNAGLSTTITTEGTTTILFTVCDAASPANCTTSAATAVALDRTPPTAPTAGTGSPCVTNVWISTASCTVTGAGATDTNQSTVFYKYWLTGATTSGSAAAPVTANTTVPITAESTTTVSWIACDAAGNCSSTATPGTFIVKLDRTAPTIPTISSTPCSSNVWQSVASCTVSAAGSTDAPSGVVSYSYVSDGVTITASAQAGNSATITNEGRTNVTFSACDPANNCTAATQFIVKLDRTAPNPPTLTPTGCTNNVWASVATCVVAASGSTDPSTNLGTPAYPRGDGTVTYAAQTVNAKTLTMSYTSGGDCTSGNCFHYVALTAPTDYTVQSGDYLVYAMQTTSGQPFAVDLKTATTWLRSTGVADQNGVSAHPATSTSTYSLNKWYTRRIPLSGLVGQTIIDYALVAEGDPAGTSSAMFRNIRICSDLQCTTTRRAIFGSAQTSIADASLSAPSSGTTSYTLTDTTTSDWATGASISIADEGRTSLTYRACDGSSPAPGNCATSTFTAALDRTSPLGLRITGSTCTNGVWVSIASCVLTSSGAVDPDTDVGMAGVGNYKYWVGGATTSGSSSSQLTGTSVTISAEGTSTMSAVVCDAAAPVNCVATGSPVTFAAKIDRTAPTQPTLTCPTGYYSDPENCTASASTDATSGLRSPANYDYEYSLDPTFATGVSSTPTPADGTWSVRARAVDNAGNLSVWSATKTILVDATPPIQPTYLNCPEGWYGVAQTCTAYGGSDPLSGLRTAPYDFEASRDATFATGVVSGTATTTFSVPSPLSDGIWYVRIRTVDKAGNVSPWVTTGTPAFQASYTKTGVCPSGNCYRYVSLSGITAYTVQTGDQLVYEVRWDQAPAGANAAMAIDLGTSTTTLRQQATAKDQNNLAAIATTDLSSYANGSWYRRVIPMSGLVGQSVTKFDVAMEGDDTGTYKASFRNVQICSTSACTVVRRVIFAYGRTGLTNTTNISQGTSVYALTDTTPSDSTVSIDTTPPTAPTASCPVGTFTTIQTCTLSGSVDVGSGLSSPKPYTYNVSQSATFASGVAIGTTSGAVLVPNQAVAIGHTLSALTGSWANNSSGTVSLAYQWQRSLDGGFTWTNISGETASDYEVTGYDAGLRVRVAVTATINSSSAIAYSEGVVVPGVSTAPLMIEDPKACAAPKFAVTCTGTAGDWTASTTITYAYQWQTSADGVTAWTNATGAGATSLDYTIATGDVGKILRLCVTATSTGGVTGPTCSTSSSPVVSSYSAFTARTSNTAQNLTSVAYDGYGVWVAVGAGGAITRSIDGVTWAVQTSGITTAISAVTWAGTQFVAVGSNGVVLTSSDGISWTFRDPIASGGTASFVGADVVRRFTGSGSLIVNYPSVTMQYLVVAGGGGGGGVIGGGGGAGGVRSGSMAVTAGTYPITVGGGGTGGVGWNNYPQLGGNGGNSVFSTITSTGGGGGSAHGGADTRPATTGGSGGGGACAGATGAAGTAGQGYAGGAGDCNYGGGGGGAGAVGNARSTGGAGVSSTITGATVWYGGGGGGGVRTGYGSGFAGGTGGGGTGTNSDSRASDGGANTGGGGGGGGHSSGTAAQVGGNGGTGVVIVRYTTVNTFSAVAYGVSTIVVGDTTGNIVTSGNNGATWTDRTSPFGGTAIRSIDYDNGTFVAVGDGGKIATSTDGITWTLSASGTTNALMTVNYGNGTFVAAGASGTLLTSTDNGASWTGRTSTFGTSQINSVAYGTRGWMAVGVGGSYAVSGDDGLTWTSVPSGMSGIFGANQVNAIVQSEVYAMVVGNAGILASGT